MTKASHLSIVRKNGRLMGKGCLQDPYNAQGHLSHFLMGLNISTSNQVYTTTQPLPHVSIMSIFSCADTNTSVKDKQITYSLLINDTGFMFPWQ